LGSNASSLESGRTSAHDGDTLSGRSSRNYMRHGLFTTSSCVVQAERQPALINAVKAIVRTNAGADIILAPLDHLADQMGVGHMRPRHANHIQQSRGDGMARCRYIRDLGCV